MLLRLSGSQHGQPGERTPGSCCLSDSLESISFEEGISKLFAIFCLRRQSLADSVLLEAFKSLGSILVFNEGRFETLFK